MIEKSKSAFQDFFIEEENEEFVWNFLNRMSHSYFVIFSYREIIVKTLEYYQNAPNIPDEWSKLIYNRIEELIIGDYKEFSEKKWSLLSMTGPLKESLFIDENCFLEMLHILTTQIGETPIDT